MAGEVSLLAALLKKQTGSKFKPKSAAAGFSKGMKGQMGQKLFQGRNSEAGANEETAVLQSPIWKAYMKKSTPQTPINDALGR